MTSKCEGRTAQDCWDCGKYFSSQSLHYNAIYNKEVAEINCFVGGFRVFDEKGKLIEKR